MEYGLTENLIFTALICAIFAFLAVYRSLGGLTASVLVLIKFSIVVIFFALFDEKQWRLYDDIAYFNIGQELLLSSDYNPFLFLFTTDNHSYLIGILGSQHYIYHWWNFLVQYIFGSYYHVPVLVNVTLTFFTAYFLFKIALKAGFSKLYAKAMSIFFLVHWEVLAWTSFVNLKEELIIFLVIVALFIIIEIFEKFKWYKLLSIILIFYLLLHLRFYTPILILAATLTWFILHFSKLPTTKKRLLLAVIFLSIPFLFIQIGRILENDQLSFNIVSWLFGMLHYLTTPRPWASPYEFFVIPAFLNWIMLPSAIAGAIMLWRRKSPIATFILCYGLIVWVAYSVFPYTVGPRHRFQIIFVLSWVQFHFLWVIISQGIMGLKKRQRINIGISKTSQLTYTLRRIIR